MGTISLIVGTYISGSNVLKTDGNAGGKSDTHGLAKPAIGVHVSVAGTLRIKDGDGNIASFVVTAGSVYPYRIAQVMSTSTTLADSEYVLLYGPGGK